MKKTKTTSLTFFLLVFSMHCFGQVQAWEKARATQKVVKDIVPGTGSSNASVINTVNNHIIFRATTSAFGYEPWITDGTADSTKILKDIVAGTSGSLTNTTVVSFLFDSVLLLVINDGVNGNELWRTDGTTNGTYLLKDINTGSASSDPSNFLRWGNKVLFTATTATYGNELWETDGTLSGTQLLKDIRTGTASSSASNFYACPQMGKVFFAAISGTTGNELWMSDGTNAGTVLLKDICVPNSSNPAGFTYYNGKVYFSANENTVGVELFVTNGTNAGTLLFKDLLPGSSSGVPQFITKFRSKLYFWAKDTALIKTLWQSDGDTANTTPINNAIVDSWTTATDLIFATDSFMLITAGDAVHGTELWIAKDNSGTIQLLNDTRPGTYGGLQSTNSFVNDRGIVYFNVQNNFTGTTELWATDGQEAYRVSSYTPEIQNVEAPKVLNGYLYFGAYNRPFNPQTVGTELFQVPLVADSTNEIAILNMSDTLLHCYYSQDSIRIPFHTQGQFAPGNKFILWSEAYYTPGIIYHDTIEATSDSAFHISLRQLPPHTGNHYFHISSTSPAVSSINNFFPLTTYGDFTNLTIPDTTLCGGADSVSIGAWAYVSMWQWNTGQTIADIKVYTPGSYWCSLTVMNTNTPTCVYSSDTVTIVQLPVGVANVTASKPSLCSQGDTVTLTCSNPSQVVWNTNDTTHAIKITTAGTYTIHVNDSTVCGSNASIAITSTVITSSFNAAVCTGSAYFYNGQNLSSAGNYNDTLTAQGGCDSIVTLNLTVNSTSGSILNASVCNGSSYSFNGQLLTVAGNYYDTLNNIHGCDSIVTLILTVNQLPIVTLIGNPDTLCINGGALTLTGGSPGGGVYSGSGVISGSLTPATTGSITITYTYTDGNSCGNSTTETIVIDSCTNHNCNASYTLYPDTTTPHNWWAVNQAIGNGPLAYTWYWGDGTNSTGATPSHTYAAAGNYNICLTINDSVGCTDTYCDSSTYIYKAESMVTVNVVSQLPTGINEAQANALISIYPNPATNQLFIQTNGEAVSEVNIYNTTGSLVSRTKELQNKSIDVSQLATGVYIAEIKTKECSARRRWVKM